jgi:DNA-binding Xre family transcriptional regulator
VPEELSAAVRAEINRLLRERGWSGRELSRRTGIAQGTLADKLSGESRRGFDLDDLDVICRELEVDVADLVTWARRQQ